MLILNENKVFVDHVDEQMVALMIETGSYYTFNALSSALLNDLGAGYSPEAVSETLRAKFGDRFSREETEAFIRDLLEAELLEETEGAGREADSEMECARVRAEDGFELGMEKYDDVASYFMIDPIHEVNPQMGWPYAKEQE